MSRNLGALNPLGLFRPVMGQLYLYLYLNECTFGFVVTQGTYWLAEEISLIALKQDAASWTDIIV
jgi:hypothetical protein